MSWNNIKQTQVTSITATIATTATNGQYVRVQGYTVQTSGAAVGSTFEIRDLVGGVSRIREQVPATGWLYVILPDNGVRFENGCFVSMADKITLGVYWG